MVNAENVKKIMKITAYSSAKKYYMAMALIIWFSYSYKTILNIKSHTTSRNPIICVLQNCLVEIKN